ncbi:hypothetical protein FPV67DRAFT_1453989 [Lyophyllum atratum]|nr:hypothetical protein FPV67DRAFT_1453989 [Lyophyllum atratum]
MTPPGYYEQDLTLPGRPACLPKLFQAFHHPLRAHISYSGRSVIYRQKLTKEAMTEALKVEMQLEIPQGTVHEVANAVVTRVRLFGVKGRWRKPDASNEPSYTEVSDELVSQNDFRRQEFARWEAHHVKFAGHIRYCVVKDKVDPAHWETVDSDFINAPPADKTKKKPKKQAKGRSKPKMTRNLKPKTKAKKTKHKSKKDVHITWTEQYETSSEDISSLYESQWSSESGSDSQVASGPPEKERLVFDGVVLTTRNQEGQNSKSGGGLETESQQISDMGEERGLPVQEDDPGFDAEDELESEEEMGTSLDNCRYTNDSQFNKADLTGTKRKEPEAISDTEPARKKGKMSDIGVSIHADTGAAYRKTYVALTKLAGHITNNSDVPAGNTSHNADGMVDDGMADDGMAEDGILIVERERPHRRRMAFKMLDDISMDSISSELEEVKTDCFDLFTSYHDDDTAASMLSKGYAAISSAITGSTTHFSGMKDIANLWLGLRQLASHQARSSISSRQERRSIMMTNYVAWYWLDVFIAKKCDMISQGGDADGYQWLARLMLTVDLFIRQQSPSHVFIPGEFSPELPGTPYLCKNRWLHRKPETAFRQGANKLIISDVIRHWLSFPSDDYRYKSWFIGAILKVVGEDMLIMDRVWKTHQTLTKGSLMETRAKDVTEADAIPFLRALAAHPLADHESPQRKALSMATIMREATYYTAQGSTPSRPPIHSLPPAIAHIGQERLALFDSFLKGTLDFFYGNRPDPEHAALHTQLANAPDRFLPFREHAPSRRNILVGHGPFSKHYARTREGFFSALIWRGVTFSSEFALSTENPTLFHSLDHWNQVKIDLNKPETYFCRKDAYGVPIAERSTDLVSKYWRASETFKWEELTKDGPVKFEDCWKWLSGGRPTRFYQLGPLSAYLLTCDYVYAGVVLPPTIEEMARTIRTINKGAVNGLNKLGLLYSVSWPAEAMMDVQPTRGDVEVEKVQRGLQSIYDRMDRLLRPGVKRDVGLDLIMVEHTLCKFSRALKDGLLHDLVMTGL